MVRHIPDLPVWKRRKSRYILRQKEVPSQEWSFEKDRLGDPQGSGSLDERSQMNRIRIIGIRGHRIGDTFHQIIGDIGFAPISYSSGEQAENIKAAPANMEKNDLSPHILLFLFFIYSINGTHHHHPGFCTSTLCERLI